MWEVWIESKRLQGVMETAENHVLVIEFKIWTNIIFIIREDYFLNTCWIN